jgi:hypothetical protein
MLSIRFKIVAVTATLLLISASQSQAGFVGTQGFNDQGTPLANGSSTGDIETASTLTIGDMNTSSASTGLFIGVGKNIDFGTINFSTTIGANTSFNLRDGSNFFGSFSSTNLSVISSGNGVESFYITGNFTPGTYSGYGSYATGSLNAGPESASITISFTQTGNGSISDSATLAVPPSGIAAVPEPASVSMIVMGLGGVFAAGRRYRRRAA